MIITRNQIIKNFVWLLSSNIGSTACNAVFSLWLARLLSPRDFGVIAISLFYFTCFNLVVNWGWRQGFMAHREIDLNTAASTHFWIRFALGGIPLITLVLGQKILQPYVLQDYYLVIIILSLIYWIERLGLTHRLVLEKTYQLKTLALLECCSMVLGYILAIIAAKNGLGIYSLVLQSFITKGLASMGYIATSPWKIGFAFDIKVAKLFLKTFGYATWLSGVFGLMLYHFMPFLIGVFSDSYQAGLYAKALMIATFPLSITDIFERLTTPLYSAYQTSMHDLKNVFMKTQAFKLFLLVPIQIFMGCTATIWIPFILGRQWVPMIPIYQVLVIYGIFRAFFDDVPALFLYGFKSPWELTRNQIGQAIIIITIGPGLVYLYQAFGGACAIALMMAVATIHFWTIVLKKLQSTPQDFFASCINIPTVMKNISARSFQDHKQL